MAKRGWFTRGVDFVRAAGAGTTAWYFLISQTAAAYIWAPLLTVWGFAAGWKEQIPTPYLLTACSLTFGGILWCFSQFSAARWERSRKLAISYDRTVPSCRADVTFGGGSHSICFRLMVSNTTTTRLHRCEGWLESTDKFPNVSPVKLFWVGSPQADMAVDLIKDVPRFLQICRITDNNRVIIATEGEVWPIDSLNAFHPGSTYRFNIALKGEDNAETAFYSVNLNWTGNWTTAEMVPVPVVDD